MRDCVGSVSSATPPLHPRHPRAICIGSPRTWVCLHSSSHLTCCLNHTGWVCAATRAGKLPWHQHGQRRRKPGRDRPTAMGWVSAAAGARSGFDNFYKDINITLERAAAMPPRTPPRHCPLLRDTRDVGGWTACCSRYFRPLAASITEDRGLADDVLQESWGKILAGVSGFRGGPVACHWVRRIITNSALDQRRRMGRRREVALGEVPEAVWTGTDPEALAISREIERSLRETVALLPETQRQIIELRFDLELSTKEAAEHLGISRSNVATRLHRAIRMLRRKFKARLGNGSGGGRP